MRKFVGLRKIWDVFGCIPHPVSFENNLERLALLAKVVGCGVLDIVGVDVCFLSDDGVFESVDENESHLYHIDDLVMVAYLEVLS